MPRTTFSAMVLALLAFSGCSYFHHSAKAAAAAPLRMIKLESTTLNLADAANAYLRLGVTLAVTSVAQGDSDTELQSVARDTVVTLASADSADDLLTPAGKDKLKQAIVAEINKRDPAAEVQTVYFDEFLVQH